MKKLVRLEDEFSDGLLNHFTYYDMIVQLRVNGNYTDLTEKLNELETRDLFSLLKSNSNDDRFVSLIQEILITRMLKKYRG